MAVAITVLSGVATMHFVVIELAMPLWIAVAHRRSDAGHDVAHRRGPAWLVRPFGVIVLATVLMMPASGWALRSRERYVGPTPAEPTPRRERR